MTQSIDYRISLNETNVIKGIAICAMLCHHLFLNHQEYGAVAFRLALISKICVTLFVFLSGYGLAIKYSELKNCASLKEKSARTIKFLAQRFVKFYANYWTVFIIMVPLGVFVFGRSLVDAYGTESFVLICAIKDFWGVQGLGSYNITWWFNRLIIFLWLLFPVLYWSMKSGPVSVCMLIFLYFNPNGYLKVLNCMAPGLSTYMVIFSLGILMAIRADKISALLNKVNPYMVAILAALTTLALLYMRNIVVTPYFIGKDIDPFAVVFLSLMVVSVSRLIQREFKVLSYVGKHSMNMYLVHTFFLAYFFPGLLYGIKNPFLIFLALLFISLFVSVVLEFVKKKGGFYKFLNIIENILKIQ